MNEKTELWKRFEKTGSVEAYLRYRERRKTPPDTDGSRDRGRRSGPAE